MCFANNGIKLMRVTDKQGVPVNEADSGGAESHGNRLRNLPEVEK